MKTFIINNNNWLHIEIGNLNLITCCFHHFGLNSFALFVTFFKRHRVRIRYGRPVDLSDFDDPKDREQISGATRRIWQAIQDLGPADGKVFI